MFPNVVSFFFFPFPSPSFFLVILLTAMFIHTEICFRGKGRAIMGQFSAAVRRHVDHNGFHKDTSDVLYQSIGDNG